MSQYSIKLFSFLYKWWKLGSFTKTLMHYQIEKNTRYYINLFFFRVWFTGNKKDQEQILASKPNLTFLNKNFTLAHGLTNSIDQYEETSIEWTIIHRNVKRSLTDMVENNGSIELLEKIMVEEINNVTSTNTERNVELVCLVDVIMMKWFGKFLIGDTDVFIQIYKEITEIMHFTFHSNTFKDIPYLGGIVSYFRRLLMMKRITKVKNDILNSMYSKVHSPGSFKCQCCFLCKFNCNLLDLDKFLDNAFLSFLVYDFVNMVAKGILIEKLKNRNFNAKNIKYEDFLTDNFLFRYRGRVMTKTIGDFKQGDICLLNLIDSGLFFSSGSRACPGYVMVKPFIEKFVDVLDKYKFSCDLNNPNNKIIRNDNIDLPIIKSTLLGCIYDKNIMNNELVIPRYTKGSMIMKNIWHIYVNKGLMKLILEEFKRCHFEYDVIIAPEARALPLAGLIANHVANNIANDHITPIIPITKSDKFGDAMSIEYKKGYTNVPDNMYIYKSYEPLIRGKKVLLVDDGISTGGTTVACIDLIKMLGGIVTNIFVMVRHHYTEADDQFKVYENITVSVFDL